MKVSQVLCAAGHVDAVTNQGLACRALFRSWGWGGEDYSAVIAPDMPRGLIRPVHELRPDPGEVLLLHYSGYARGLEALFGADGRRSLLVSHNITPPEYLWAHEPVEGVRCEMARGQLAGLAAVVGELAGVSRYNADELEALSGGRRADVIPVLFDPSPLGSAASAQPPRPPVVVFVGRLAPHKRQDLVIRAFARYRGSHAPEARLVLVGTPMSEEFGASLRRLADEVAPGAVSFERGVSADRLAAIYRSAHAFLCLSEHEGFCIPLLEAFHFGVPVVARDAGALPEVVGDAGVVLAGTDSLDTAAAALALVVGDEELRSSLRERGERRLEEYALERTAERLRSKLTTLAGQ
jgi:glycosyltransferase involved in cell wall biosynthesis